MPAPPLRQFVLKVHSRCDLACDHCYIYEHADQSWRTRPLVMARETVRAAAQRIAEHAADHRLDRVGVVLHGGEPLLMGAAALRSTLAQLRRTIEPVAMLDLRMQSNGVLLSAALCELLLEHRVSVGISLDGGAAANDRHRRFATGASSYPHAVRALNLLRRPEFRPIYGGILCTIDVRNDPVEVYAALVAHDPPRLDLLLPHATWDSPPIRPGDDPTPYATWLGRVFERWTADGQPVPIRLFDSLRALAGGGPSGTESVGLDPVDLVVIETDGSWEQADSLKTAFDGAPGTGMSIFRHTASEVAARPELARRRQGLAGLCATCRACPVVRQCGGGLFAHRYRTGSGFDNPSVYCADLVRLIGVVSTPPLPVRRGGGPAASGAALQAAGVARRSASTWSRRRLVAVIDDVGAGYAGAAATQYLADAELSITRALLVAVAARRPASGAGDGWTLLERLDRDFAATVHPVLEHPHIRVWAVDWLRRHHHGGEAGVDLLACLAAAAAVRAGVAADIAVPIVGRTIHLPTLGSLTLPGAGDRLAVLSSRAGGFRVRAGGHDVTVALLDGDAEKAAPAPGWRAISRVELDGFSVAIEDDDPHRDCYEWPVTQRLTPAALDAWVGSLAGAWREIGRVVPGHLPGLRRALRAVVPLVGGRRERRSATARDAFGAVGATLAPAGALAVLLTHEFQHVKLGALMDLCDLVDPDDRARLRVGWRPDPRPLDAVLQGTYAHLGVADLWRARAAVTGPRQAAAVREFHRYRSWTETAIDALAASGALTAAGQRFVAQMAVTLGGWAR